MAILVQEFKCWRFNHRLYKGVANASPTITPVKSCQETIWPRTSSDTGNQNLSCMGFALKVGDSKSIPVPTSWNGNIWAQTHCSENSSGWFNCLTGDCGSCTVECIGGSITPLVTLAEFTFTTESTVFYDVSLVNGFNLPMLVVPVDSRADY